MIAVKLYAASVKCKRTISCRYPVLPESIRVSRSADTALQIRLWRRVISTLARHVLTFGKDLLFVPAWDPCESRYLLYSTFSAVSQRCPVAFNRPPFLANVRDSLLFVFIRRSRTVCLNFSRLRFDGGSRG